ncbi:fimbrial biogenesis chaperone [Ramlibacter alkalitolerans]|uniref:Molecular chaperone n=1 Tax=Ramlibacter alkalitolerans TaxID=2039631 RepID=A0ABS1JMX6_9BURK|nr:fimbria/pilus periplasmic chaperone [Ramlibacter alkalitolerans]MBL0425481.1 molecular chaperone [Ramlibacter alkalitolerans]
MKHSLPALLLLLAASVLPADAAQFTITPVRIFMTPRDRAVAVTVTNDSDEEVVMQADLYAWKQRADGSDDLQLTEDLILTPPILKLAPRARQVVRLARLSPPPEGVQQTYRLVVREVPEARSSEQMQLQVALAFSLPVFISPPGVKRELQCGLERAAPDQLRALCSNGGNAYAQIRALEVFDARGAKVAARDVGGYLLPSVRRSFELRGADGRIAGGKVKLQVALDDGSLQAFDATLPE